MYLKWTEEPIIQIRGSHVKMIFVQSELMLTKALSGKLF